MTSAYQIQVGQWLNGILEQNEYLELMEATIRIGKKYSFQLQKQTAEDHDCIDQIRKDEWGACSWKSHRESKSSK